MRPRRRSTRRARRRLRALREVATETAATVIGRLTGAPPDQGRLDGAIGAALAARRIG